MHLIPLAEPPWLERSECVRIEKGWGYELWIVNESYCGKLLHFEEGRRCSWHYHNVKDEVFYLQSGRLRLRFGFSDELSQAREVILTPGRSFRVPPGLRHQMEALEDSDLFEFSTHHEEEDSIRVVRGD